MLDPGSSQEHPKWMNKALTNLISFVDTTSSPKAFDSKKDITWSDVSSLLQDLTSTSTTDNGFIQQFLTCYRYFIQPSLLLKKFIVRFVAIAQSNDKKNTEKALLLEKILNIIEIWISDHFYDFENDFETLKTLQTFLVTTVSQTGYL